MAKKKLNKIFLSASIPYQERDKKFYDTADVVAIRDSVRALATVVIPKAMLVWGGHPAITPLIRFVMLRMNSNLQDHVTLYQSDYFKKDFSPENIHFENIHIVEKENNREKSIHKKRIKMLGENNFSAGIFIGGMEGVVYEYEIFRKLHPNALALPIASSGGAAKTIFEKDNKQLNLPDITVNRLANDYAYMSLFKDLLSKFIN